MKSELGFPLDLKGACRWVGFQTPIEGHEYATHGGTLFLTSYQGSAYGVTARHNRHTFAWNDLIVAKRRIGNDIAHVTAVSSVSKGLGYAEGSDLLDIAVVQFSGENPPSYFDEGIYDLDRQKICTSRIEDGLTIYGAMSQDSSIGEKTILTTFGELGFVDTGPNGYDMSASTR